MEFLVGDNVRRVKGWNGGPQSGGYEGKVTTVSDDMLYFADGSWGLASRFELVFPEIEEGKFYSTRDGRKIGPISRNGTRGGGLYWTAPQLEDELFGSYWYQSGEFHKRGDEDFSPRSFAFDLVAEWVEPAFKVEEGKFYKTRDGLKVGPAVAKPYDLFDLGDVFPECHFADGRYRLKGENPNDLVAEYVEPVLTVEEGKYYRTREGEVLGPYGAPERDIIKVGQNFDTARYVKGGGIFGLGRNRCEMPGDLVEEVPAPAPAPTGPVIEVTRSQIVPGVYDGVRVGHAPANGFVSVYLSNGSASADELEAAAKVLTELAKAVRNA